MGWRRLRKRTKGKGKERRRGRRKMMIWYWAAELDHLSSTKMIEYLILYLSVDQVPLANDACEQWINLKSRLRSRESMIPSSFLAAPLTIRPSLLQTDSVRSWCTRGPACKISYRKIFVNKFTRDWQEWGERTWIWARACLSLLYNRRTSVNRFEARK